MDDRTILQRAGGTQFLDGERKFLSGCAGRSDGDEGSEDEG